MTKEEKVEAVYKAIDALIDLCGIDGFNSHEIVNSENSTVSKLRDLVYKLEDE